MRQQRKEIINMMFFSATSVLQSFSPKLLRKALNCGQNERLPLWRDLRNIKKKKKTLQTKSLSLPLVCHIIILLVSSNNNNNEIKEL